MTDEDKWYRIQGRMNAFENLLISLVMDRAAIHQEPYGWINQYVANLRTSRPDKVLGPTSVDGIDVERVSAETSKAISELADVVEQHGQIFLPTSSRQ